ncbi:hypothetical protein pb186bvf_014521 [Paramecium bursaria]
MYQQLNLGYNQIEICEKKGEFKFLNQHNQFILFNVGRTLRLYDLKQMQMIKYINIQDISPNHNVVSATYSKKYEIYIVVIDDWITYIFSSDLEFLSKFQFPLQYPVSLYFLDNEQSIIIVGVKWIDKIVLDISNKSKKTFRCELKARKQFQGKSEYNRGSLLHQKTLFVYEAQSIKEFDVDGNYYAQLNNLVKSDSYITCLLYFPIYQYIVGGCTNSNVYAWRQYDGSIVNIFETQSTKTVSCLYPDRELTQFWSCSGQIIQLYSIQTWQCLQQYQISQANINIQFLGQRTLISCNDNRICVLNRQTEQCTIYKHEADLLQILQPNNYTSTFILDNNCCIQYQSEQPIPLNVFYQPSKFSVKSVYFYKEIYYLLMDDNAILKLFNHDFKIILYPDQLKDVQGNNIKDEINIILIPKMQIPYNIYSQTIQESICYAFDDGQIGFADQDQINSLQMQFSIHRCKYLFLVEVKECFVSLDKEWSLKVSKFINQNLQVIQQFKTNVAIQNMKGIKNRLFIITQATQIHYYKLKNNNFLASEYDQLFDDNKFIDIKIYEDPKMICTLSPNYIRLLTYRKVLIIQIDIDQLVQGFSFHQGFLLVYLQNEISKLQHKDLFIDNKKIKNLNSQAIKRKNYTLDILKVDRGQIYKMFKKVYTKVDLLNKISLSKPQIETVQNDEPQRRLKTQHIDRRPTAVEARCVTLPKQDDKTRTRTISILSKPAIPQFRIKMSPLDSFINDRIKKKKYKSRRDCTINKIIQRNIHQLQN